MKDQQGIARRMGALPPRSELALASGATAVMAADSGQAAWPLLALFLVLPAGMSLAWRLRMPEIPLALTCGLDLLLKTTAPGEYAPQTIVLGVVVALYSAAAHLTGRRAALAAAFSLIAVWAAHVLSAEGNRDDFLPFAVWAVPWVAGRLVRRQTLMARQAGARAALAEVQAGQATAAERDRIARELHDVVAHSVSLMVVQAGAERMALGEAAPRTRAALDAIETAGRQALVELRAMLGVLRSAEAGDERSRPRGWPTCTGSSSRSELRACRSGWRASRCPTSRPGSAWPPTASSRNASPTSCGTPGRSPPWSG